MRATRGSAGESPPTRRRRGISQTALAGLVGRSESWLSQVERGARSVDRLSVLVDLAEILHVDVADLIRRPWRLAPNGGPLIGGLDTVRHTLAAYPTWGYITAFGAIDGGRCWACMGEGSRSVLVSSIRARERRQAKRAAEHEASAAERMERIGSANDAAVAAIVATFPAFTDARCSGVIGRTRT